MQKVFEIKKNGDKNILELTSVDIPIPKDDEVLVKHTAIGVNFVEYDMLRGTVVIPGNMVIPGVEAVGIIEKIGKDVRGFSKGQRVGYATLMSGAYSEYRVIKPFYLYTVPEIISDEAAATFMHKGLTAHYLMRRTFFLQAGMTMMINGAASNVGKLMMKIAERFNINVIANVGSEEKKNAIKDYKFLDMYNYLDDDLEENVMNLTIGAGVQVVYDFIGMDSLKKSLRCLTNFGLAVSAGNASGQSTNFDCSLLINKAIFLATPRLAWYKLDKQELMLSIKEVCTFIAAEIFPSKADKKYNFDQIPEALKDIESRSANSRVILLS